ncbi:hypothetical protein E4U42_004968 [Claviceps africana]|uniref:TM7S3/TM198-like domain-containing protein n=1 Tax=Claviceps africana TaxID=83212 RepID=A0A8K0J490_9HYPO|nr:hypothetical protein E4U42_004968 [Claviceps africana]
MKLIASGLRALVFLVLTVRFAHSRAFALVERQAGATPIASPITSPARSKSTDASGRDQDGNGSRESSAPSDRSDVSAFVTVLSSPTRTTASSVLPTATSSVFLDNSTFYNVTIPAGQLPLAPQLTPGWGVAGVVMLVTGVVYTLVGIKNRWIHTFFSTAYMTALGVAVLIVYVMNLPVSNALQGGYIVAVIMSGCAVGGAAMFFKELTEGFGCALGGFCMSMWLLCLVPGGLLHTLTSKTVFIASFTLAGFALYFSVWTRDTALIVLIAFGGSTVTVLGIDCFSRAGLKEFWAYVWAVNDNLFPLGADTYPVTKGIRVETAAIVFLFLAGVVSQIKLWKIVREKRAKRAADRAQDQQNLEREEENVGRQIEESNGRERREWELVYGDGTAGSITESRVTDIGETGSEKGLQPGYMASKIKSSADVIEMAATSESDQSRHVPEALMAMEDEKEGKITVRVAADEIPESTTDVEGETLDEKTEPRQEAKYFTDNKRNSRDTTVSRRVSQALTITEAPEIVPLPFTVPQANEVRSDDDRSSIATFADDAEETTSADLPKDRHLARQLSKGSASLLRNSFQISERTGGSRADGSLAEAGQSTEELVTGRIGQPDDDDDRSLAATVDDESISGADMQSIMEDSEQNNVPEETELARRSIEIHAQLGIKEDELHNGNNSMPQDTERSQPVSATPDSFVGLEQSLDMDKADSRVGEPRRDEEKISETCRPPSTDPNLPQPHEIAKSVASVSSIPTSLTTERLPRPLSRVAMSYRTNEWAKHLSAAECPETEELPIPVRSTTVKNKEKEPEEQPVPVNVEELQQTAENGGPLPGVRRSFSIASGMGNPASDSRQSSKQELPAITDVAVPMYPTGRDSPFGQRMPRSSMGAPAPILKKIPSGLRHSSSIIMPIAEESTGHAADDLIAKEVHELPQPLSRQSSVAAFDTRSQASMPPVSRSPAPGVVSYASPQTLIGQREMFLRTKSQGTLLSNTPEPPVVSQGPGSDAGSLHDYSIYSAALCLSDADDVPLSQRKEIIRQSSMMSLSRSSVQPIGAHTRPIPGHDSVDSLMLKSHQTNRLSTLPSFVAREAQLASFRQSVQHDLRSGSPVMMTSGRETPFRSSSLLAGGREAEIQRNIEMQRSVLMAQKEAEAQRREMQKREKEHVDRAFDERMRNGDMLEAHRAAMRRMQNEAK